MKFSDSPIMGKDIESLNLDVVSRLAHNKHDSDSTSGGKQFFVCDQFFMSMDASSFGPNNLHAGIPYRIEEGRSMLVKRGWVKVVINLVEHRIEQGSIAVLVPHSIFEIVEWADDFDLMVFSFSDLPVFAELSRHAVLTLNESQHRLVRTYYDLMWQVVHQVPMLIEEVNMLQTSLLIELKRIAAIETVQFSKSVTRQQTIFDKFIELVNNNGLRERRIAFYANQLCVTPNYLGDVIKRVSGLTIMQWINRFVVQQAKMLLRYSDTPIWEVAEKLNFANPSFFSNFFKRETGLTPNEFRNASHSWKNEPSATEA